MNVVEYAVTVGSKLTAEEASADLFPDAKVVLVGEERRWRSVTYYFLVAWPDGRAA